MQQATQEALAALAQAARARLRALRQARLAEALAERLKSRSMTAGAWNNPKPIS